MRIMRIHPQATRSEWLIFSLLYKSYEYPLPGYKEWMIDLLSTLQELWVSTPRLQGVNDWSSPYFTRVMSIHSKATRSEWLIFSLLYKSYEYPLPGYKEWMIDLLSTLQELWVSTPRLQEVNNKSSL